MANANGGEYHLPYKEVLLSVLKIFMRLGSWLATDSYGPHQPNKLFLSRMTKALVMTGILCSVTVNTILITNYTDVDGAARKAGFQNMAHLLNENIEQNFPGIEATLIRLLIVRPSVRDLERVCGTVNYIGEVTVEGLVDIIKWSNRLLEIEAKLNRSLSAVRSSIARLQAAIHSRRHALLTRMADLANGIGDAIELEYYEIERILTFSSLQIGPGSVSFQRNDAQLYWIQVIEDSINGIVQYDKQAIQEFGEVSRSIKALKDVIGSLEDPIYKWKIFKEYWNGISGDPGSMENVEHVTTYGRVDPTLPCLEYGNIRTCWKNGGVGAPLLPKAVVIL